MNYLEMSKSDIYEHLQVWNDKIKVCLDVLSKEIVNIVWF